jgi:GcrA cell cycle regulator
MIATLRALWAEGLSTAAIGRRMSITKNAVVGKANRLGLPARAIPIVPKKPRKPRLIGRAPKWALPREEAPSTLPALIAPVVPIAAPAPAAAPSPRPVVFVQVSKPCCWPINDPPRGGKWLWCEADSIPGKPYCPEHTAVAYVARTERGAVETDDEARRRLAAVRRVAPCVIARNQED